MRLIRIPESDAPLEIVLDDIIGQPCVPYAILSHTWGQEEVLYSDVTSAHYIHMAGWTKIASAMKAAQTDQLSLLWVDTCCIDKNSSAELSEAINSMYKWYNNAATCYAYLADVTASLSANWGSHNEFLLQFAQARWFTRGWTLQELLAPRSLEFYNQSWQPLGSKIRLVGEISAITNIQASYLTGASSFFSASVSRRMSWAARRQTSRIEDIAYCLMGLFDVNMPMLYGEGEKAFVRLQEEILRYNDDQTIFAWSKPSSSNQLTSTFLPYNSESLFAASPLDFESSGHLVPIARWSAHTPMRLTSKGVEIELFLQVMAATDEFLLSGRPHLSGLYYYAALDCWPTVYIILRRSFQTGDNVYQRCSSEYWPNHPPNSADSSHGRRQMIWIGQASRRYREEAPSVARVLIDFGNLTLHNELEVLMLDIRHHIAKVGRVLPRDVSRSEGLSCQNVPAVVIGLVLGSKTEMLWMIRERTQTTLDESFLKLSLSMRSGNELHCTARLLIDEEEFDNDMIDDEAEVVESSLWSGQQRGHPLQFTHGQHRVSVMVSETISSTLEGHIESIKLAFDGTRTDSSRIDQRPTRAS